MRHSAASVAEDVRRALVKREYKRALSILEQGIVTLATEPAELPDDPYDDPTPMHAIGISVQIMEAIEKHYGLMTVGKLRRLVKDGKLRNVPAIGERSEQLISDALVAYKPRRNRHGTINHHG